MADRTVGLNSDEYVSWLNLLCLRVGGSAGMLCMTGRGGKVRGWGGDEKESFIVVSVCHVHRKK